MTPPAAGRGLRASRRSPLPGRPVEVVFHPLARPADRPGGRTAALLFGPRSGLPAPGGSGSPRRGTASSPPDGRGCAAAWPPGSAPITAMLPLLDGPWGKPRAGRSTRRGGTPLVQPSAIPETGGDSAWRPVRRRLDIGVDIEATRRLDDLDGMARLAFHSPRGRSLARRARGREAGRLLPPLDALKEAVMKAVGLGFHLAPHGFRAGGTPGRGRRSLAALPPTRGLRRGGIGVADLAVPVPEMAGAVALVGARPIPRTVSPLTGRGSPTKAAPPGRGAASARDNRTAPRRGQPSRSVLFLCPPACWPRSTASSSAASRPPARSRARPSGGASP